MKPIRILFVLFIFSLTVFAQDRIIQSEMEGYEFFGKGRLESLKFGTSTKEDVKNIFGSVCEDSECDFNDKWNVKFEYFNIPWRWLKEGELWNYYTANPDYKDKLYRIKLIPKARIPFEQLKIACRSTVTLQDCKRTDNPKAGSEDLPYSVSYAVRSRSNQACVARYGECKRGDLDFNSYWVRYEFEKKMFVFQSSSPNPPSLN